MTSRGWERRVVVRDERDRQGTGPASRAAFGPFACRLARRRIVNCQDLTQSFRSGGLDCPCSKARIMTSFPVITRCGRLSAHIQRAAADVTGLLITAIFTLGTPCQVGIARPTGR